MGLAGDQNNSIVAPFIPPQFKYKRYRVNVKQFLCTSTSFYIRCLKRI